MGKIKLPVPVIEVVPHKEPMCLLDQVIEHDAQKTCCDVRIKEDSLFLENKQVNAWVGLEYMAQAVAAHAGLSARQHGKPPAVGFLLGTRKADFFTTGYRIGQTLHITARHVWGEGDLFSFDCFIEDQASRKRLAEAQLNVFRPADLKQFVKDSV